MNIETQGRVWPFLIAAAPLVLFVAIIAPHHIPGLFWLALKVVAGAVSGIGIDRAVFQGMGPGDLSGDPGACRHAQYRRAGLIAVCIIAFALGF